MRLVGCGSGVLGAAACCLFSAAAGASPCAPAELECPSGYRCATYGECVPEAPPEEGPFARRRVVAADTTFFTRPNNGHRQTIDAIVLRAAFPTGSTTFEPEVPLVYDASLDAGAALLAGNPTFSVKGHWMLEPRLELYAGGGVTLPIASAEGENIDHVAPFLLATASQGLWNIWWYSSDAAAVFLPFGARYVASTGFELAVEGATGLSFPLRTGLDHYGLGILQAGVTVGYVSSEFEAGARLRGVRIPGNDVRDPFQSSLEPFARVVFGRVFTGAGFVWNLDGPLGPFNKRGSIWGLRIEFGTTF